MDSKEYSWKWVTADELLSYGPCEVLYAKFIPSGPATATATLYNNEEASGEVIVAWRTAQSLQADFMPPVPVYCEHGLYVDALDNVKGIFIQWREL